eukprot:ANDGO_02057.mRNA.2 hypothetical protein SAMD00019534_069540
MVKVGDAILGVVDDLNFKDRPLALEIVYSILGKMEFLPEALATSKEGGWKSKLGLSKDRSKIANAYKMLLWNALHYALQKAKDPVSRNWEHVSLFTAQVMGLGYYRIPGIQEMTTRMALFLPCTDEQKLFFFDVEYILQDVAKTTAHARRSSIAACLKSLEGVSLSATPQLADTAASSSSSVAAEASFSSDTDRWRKSESSLEADFRERVFRFRLFAEQLDQPRNLNQIIADLSGSTEWMKDYCKSREFLFSFYDDLSEQAILLMGGNPKLVVWSAFPIYRNLVCNFFAPAMHKSPAHYSEEWSAESAYFLRNPDLVFPMFWLVMKNTNLFDRVGLLRTLDLIDGWFHFVGDWKMKVSSSFPLPAFISILDVLLEISHYEIVLRTLILIFHALDAFCGILRITFFTEFILKKNFVPLFLHWNREVSMCYQRICVYKLVRITKTFPKKKNLKRPNDVFDALESDLPTRADNLFSARPAEVQTSMPDLNSDIRSEPWSSTFDVAVPRTSQDDTSVTAPQFPASGTAVSMKDGKKDLKTKILRIAKLAKRSDRSKTHNNSDPSDLPETVEEVDPLLSSSVVKIFGESSRRYSIDVVMARKSGYAVEVPSEPSFLKGPVTSAAQSGTQLRATPSRSLQASKHISYLTPASASHSQLDTLDSGVLAGSSSASTSNLLSSRDFRKLILSNLPVSHRDEVLEAVEELAREERDSTIPSSSKNGAILGLEERSSDTILKCVFETYVHAVREVVAGKHSPLIPLQYEPYCLQALQDLEIVFKEYDAWLRYILASDDADIYYPQLSFPRFVLDEKEVDIASRKSAPTPSSGSKSSSSLSAKPVSVNSSPQSAAHGGPDKPILTSPHPSPRTASAAAGGEVVSRMRSVSEPPRPSHT